MQSLPWEQREKERWKRKFAEQMYDACERMRQANAFFRPFLRMRVRLRIAHYLFQVRSRQHYYRRLLSGQKLLPQFPMLNLAKWVEQIPESKGKHIYQTMLSHKVYSDAYEEQMRALFAVLRDAEMKYFAQRLRKVIDQETEIGDRFGDAVLAMGCRFGQDVEANAKIDRKIGSLFVSMG